MGFFFLAGAFEVVPHHLECFPCQWKERRNQRVEASPYAQVGGPPHDRDDRAHHRRGHHHRPGPSTVYGRAPSDVALLTDQDVQGAADLARLGIPVMDPATEVPAGRLRDLLSGGTLAHENVVPFQAED